MDRGRSATTPSSSTPTACSRRPPTGTGSRPVAPGRRRAAPGPSGSAGDGLPDRLRLLLQLLGRTPRGVPGLAEREVDLVVHLGDYIYEDDGSGGPRRHRPPRAALTLDDYRQRLAQVREDPDCQALHRRHPMTLVWDDHDLADNAWRDGAKEHDQPSRGRGPTGWPPPPGPVRSGSRPASGPRPARPARGGASRWATWRRWSCWTPGSKAVTSRPANRAARPERPPAVVAGRRPAGVARAADG